jgi:hypothetical protein
MFAVAFQTDIGKALNIQFQSPNVKNVYQELTLESSLEW